MLKLNEDGITPPQEYYYQKKNKKNPRRTNGLWSESVVKSMLRNEAYIGHMIQGKVGTVSYKNSKIICKGKDEWIKAENTHEPIITIELWDRVQALLAKNVKTRKHKHRTYSVAFCTALTAVTNSAGNANAKTVRTARNTAVIITLAEATPEAAKKPVPCTA